MMFRKIFRRLQFLVQSGERARLLREEMDIHISIRAQELMDDGMPEAEAYTQARRRFGNVTRQQEESREIWIVRWWTDLVQDAIFALRTLRQQPGFTLIAVLSAGLGIGACCLIFGLANFALMRPLPVEEPDRLLSVSGKTLPNGKMGTSLSYPDYADLSKAQSFQGLTAFNPFMPAAISGQGDPQRYWGTIATANYFDVVRPVFAIGRGFDAQRDDKPGESPVVVLSYPLWQSRFGSDRGLVGQLIELNGRKVTVTGVTAPGFRGTELGFASDFWLPFSALDTLAQVGMGGERLQQRGNQWLQTAGRLQEGFSTQSAASEIEVIGRGLREAYPSTNKTKGFHVERAGQVNPGFRKMMVLFFGMVLAVAVLVLLTACANVANLLLARASARQREIATRLAIGAGRGRIVRQLLTESVFLALLGGVVGYGVAQLGATAIGRTRLPLNMPVDLSISLDYRVLLFCIALSALTGIIFGLVPALRATKPDLVSGLKDGQIHAGSSPRFGLRGLLVVAQVCICTILLVCCGLFQRSFYSAAGIEPGFTHRNLLMLGFDPSLNRYSPQQIQRIVSSILENAAAMPGVESATLSTSIPLSMEGTQNSFTSEGQMGDGEENRRITADIYSVAPRFFETFGIRILQGDDFGPGIPSEDIAIANQALVDRAFPGQSAVGRRIQYQGRTVRISGVVATTKSRTIGEDPRPTLYFPIARDMRGNDSLTGITLVLRTQGEAAGYVQPARQMFRRVDPALAVFDVRTMKTQLSQALFAPRMAAFLFGFAGLIGVLISSIGIYGVISYSVARQTREIGIRMALGAKRASVLSMVIRRAVLLTAIGTAGGIGLSLILSKVAESLLYGISPRDPLTYLVAPVLLFLVAMIAGLIPARRAAWLDPMRALRHG